MSWLDKLLNRLTVYQLVIQYLVGLLVVTIILSFRGILPFNAWSLIGSTLIILITGFLSNIFFAWAFDANFKIESTIIALLILALIISPISTGADFWLLFWAATLAMASKYILAIMKIHLFNPAAIAVVITALFLNQSASWWIGTASMLPYVLIGGLLIARKMRRGKLVWAFVVTVFITTFVISIFKGTNLITAASRITFESSLFFFAFAMLTEPKTAPFNKKALIFYGVLVGFLFSPQVHFGSLYLTPEIALVIGNIFAFFAKIVGRSSTTNQNNRTISTQTVMPQSYR